VSTSTTQCNLSPGWRPSIETTMAGTVARRDFEFFTLGMVFWQIETASRVRTRIRDKAVVHPFNRAENWYSRCAM
jgi:hypothetical protein